MADAHIGRPSASLKADLAAEATTLAQSRHILGPLHLLQSRAKHHKGAAEALEGSGAEMIGVLSQLSLGALVYRLGRATGLDFSNGIGF